MVTNVKLKVSVNDDYEWLIDNATGEILVEAPQLRAEDVLYGLGYKFAIEVDPEEE
jgi:hypothetical protein